MHNMHTSNDIFFCFVTNGLALFIISFFVLFFVFFSYYTIVHSFHMFCLVFVLCFIVILFQLWFFFHYYLFRFVCGVVPKLFGFVCFELMEIVCGFCDLCIFYSFFLLLFYYYFR